MYEIRSTGVIKQPLKEVFEYAASPFNGPAFVPNLNENINITPEQVGVGQEFDWHFNMAGVDLKGHASVVGYEYLKFVKIQTIGESESLWTYEFEADGDDTKIAVVIEYELPDTTIERFANKVLIEKINRKTAEQIIDNLKTILED